MFSSSSSGKSDLLQEVIVTISNPYPTSSSVGSNSALLSQEDVAMIDQYFEERSTLQVLVDEVRHTVSERGDERGMELEFMAAIYDLNHSRTRIKAETFMETMKRIFEPYPDLLLPLNNYMPGYMECSGIVKDDSGRKVMKLTWKDFTSMNNKM